MPLKRQIARIIPDFNTKVLSTPSRVPNIYRSAATGTRVFGQTPLYSSTIGGGGGDRRDRGVSGPGVFNIGGGGVDPLDRIKRGGKPVSHIFGIPHSLKEIAGGLFKTGIEYLGGSPIFDKGPVFGGDPRKRFEAQGIQEPNLWSGFDIFDSAPEMLEEGLDTFGEVWEESRRLNVPEDEQAVGNFLGCPVEDDTGCQPARKRYTITIDNATGKCVKIKRQKSRKRRRRLATLSDIKDLAALKQVIGGGKAFDTWIATRGR